LLNKNLTIRNKSLLREGEFFLENDNPYRRDSRQRKLFPVIGCTIHYRRTNAASTSSERIGWCVMPLTLKRRGLAPMKKYSGKQEKPSEDGQMLIGRQI